MRKFILLCTSLCAMVFLISASQVRAQNALWVANNGNDTNSYPGDADITLFQITGKVDLKNLNITGNEMRLVKLPENSPRGGVLTHGSVLVVTSNPTRTSPVIRGPRLAKRYAAITAEPVTMVAAAASWGSTVDDSARCRSTSNSRSVSFSTNEPPVPERRPEKISRIRADIFSLT
jgi:hypothetical protein